MDFKNQLKMQAATELFGFLKGKFFKSSAQPESPPPPKAEVYYDEPGLTGGETFEISSQRLMAMNNVISEARRYRQMGNLIDQAMGVEIDNLDSIEYAESQQ